MITHLIRGMEGRPALVRRDFTCPVTGARGSVGSSRRSVLPPFISPAVTAQPVTLTSMTIVRVPPQAQADRRLPMMDTEGNHELGEP
jgi:hypothetical protein